MTGTKGTPGPKLPSCPENMGGTLPLAEKKFIHPLMRDLAAQFGSLSAFGRWTLGHRLRPDWAQPECMHYMVYSRLSGSPQYFPQWPVLKWVVYALDPDATTEQRELELQRLAYQWEALGKGRPPGYRGRLRNEPALTHPSQAADEATLLAILVEVYVPQLECRLAELERDLQREQMRQAPTGRHHLHVDAGDDVDSGVSYPAGPHVPSPDAALRSELLRVTKAVTALEMQIETMRAQFASTISGLHADLTTEALKVDELQDELQAQGPIRRDSALTQFLPAVNEQLEPNGGAAADSTSFDRKRSKRVWTPPEIMRSDDSTVDTTVMSPGTVHELRANTPPVKENETPDGGAVNIKSVLDARARD